MAHTDFFRINLPYGIKKNSSSEWFVFNREYVPLGWNSTVGAKSIYDENAYPNYPVYTRYQELTEDAILKIITGPDSIQRNKEGEIDKVFFYNDRQIRNQVLNIGMTISILLKHFQNLKFQPDKFYNQIV